MRTTPGHPSTRRTPLRAIAGLPFRFRAFRDLSDKLIQNLAFCKEVLNQRDLLERERDELKGHCERLERQLAESHGRENQLATENLALVGSRDALERERDELAEYCRILNQQIQGAEAEPEAPEDDLIRKMRSDWDQRARINAEYYTNSANVDWDEDGYLKSGECNVSEHILNDMTNVCQGLNPKSMRVLELGCGAGRMTRALAGLFGEVHAVDISAEMIRLAQRRLSDFPNVFLYHNSGRDLSVVPAGELYDFALSFIVFQHIPAAEVIESYVREVHQLLRPGRLFKFQVQGFRPQGHRKPNTWVGADLTVEDMKQMASRSGFEMRHWHGDGTQYFWLWFFKR